MRTLPEKGDHEGFASFYRAYEGAVTAYMRRRVSSSELAADLTMEVFAAALLAVNQDRGPAGDAIGWLFGIARHKLVDTHRTGQAEQRARRRLGMERVILNDSDLERIDQLTHEDKVLELLHELPPEQRDAVRARIVDQREYDDIAQEAQATSTVMRQRVSRGLRHLRAQMKEGR